MLRLQEAYEGTNGENGRVVEMACVLGGGEGGGEERTREHIQASQRRFHI